MSLLSCKVFESKHSFVGLDLLQSSMLHWNLTGNKLHSIVYLDNLNCFLSHSSLCLSAPTKIWFSLSWWDYRSFCFSLYCKSYFPKWLKMMQCHFYPQENLKQGISILCLELCCNPVPKSALPWGLLCLNCFPTSLDYPCSKDILHTAYSL